jgi:hypothetical protein
VLGADSITDTTTAIPTSTKIIICESVHRGRRGFGYNSRRIVEVRDEGGETKSS